jgi:hypothetical protein
VIFGRFQKLIFLIAVGNNAKKFSALSGTAVKVLSAIGDGVKKF